MLRFIWIHVECWNQMRKLVSGVGVLAYCLFITCFALITCSWWSTWVWGWWWQWWWRWWWWWCWWDVQCRAARSKTDSHTYWNYCFIIMWNDFQRNPIRIHSWSWPTHNLLTLECHSKVFKAVWPANKFKSAEISEKQKLWSLENPHKTYVIQKNSCSWVAHLKLISNRSRNCGTQHCCHHASSAL